MFQLDAPIHCDGGFTDNGSLQPVLASASTSVSASVSGGLTSRICTDAMQSEVVNDVAVAELVGAMLCCCSAQLYKSPVPDLVFNSRGGAVKREGLQLTKRSVVVAGGRDASHRAILQHLQRPFLVVMYRSVSLGMG